MAGGVFFARGVIDYGPGECLTQRAGQNRATRTATRLTGDVAALVLSGEAVPDSAVALLAVDAAGRLLAGNRAVAASELLRRYHRRGRAARTAHVGGPGAPPAPNTVAVALPQLTAPQVLDVQSVRPQREQAGQSARLCSLAELRPTTRLVTTLTKGLPAARLLKATLHLLSGVVTLDAAFPAPDSTTPAPVPTGRQFSDQFSDQFD